MKTGTPLPLWRRYPALFLAVAWLTGQALAAWLDRPWPLWAGLLALGLAWLLLWPDVSRAAPFRKAVLRAWGVFLGLALMALAAGGWRWASARGSAQRGERLRELARREASVRLVGQVVRPPRRREDWLIVVVEARRVRCPPEGPARPVAGRVQVSWPAAQAPSVAYGDVLVLQGALRLPLSRGDFDYRAYLARRGVYALMQGPRTGVLQHGQGNPLVAGLYTLREHAHRVVRRLWPEPEAGLFAGVLLGLDDDIPEEVYDAFRAAGTAHVIVISGFNIAVLSALFLGLFRRWLPWGWAAVCTAAVLAAYTVLVGGDAPVVRAAFMGGLGLLARHLGRRSHGLTTLAVTAAVMTALHPQALLDVAFQLSFAATLGLILYGQSLVDAFTAHAARFLPSPWPQRLAGPVGEFFLLTLAAQWAVLPVTVVHFGRVSLVALLANPLVLPAQTPLMVLGGLALLVGLAWPGAAQPLARAAWPWAAYTIRVSEAFAHLPGASVPVDASTFLALYAGLGALVLLAPLRQRVRRLPRGAWVGALWVLAAVLWTRAVPRVPHPPHLRVWVLNARGGQAVLLQTPRDGTVLVNGGASGTVLNHALARWLAGSHRTLDWWVVTSIRENDIAGLLDALERHPPRRVLWLPTALGPTPARRLRKALQAADVPIAPCREGAALTWNTEGSLTVARCTPTAADLLLSWRAFDLYLAWNAPPEAGARRDAWDVLFLPERSRLGSPSGQNGGFYLRSFTEIWMPLEGYRWVLLRTNGVQWWLSGSRVRTPDR